jgi:hypothetical protein
MLLMAFPRKQDGIFNEPSIYFWDNCIFGFYDLGFSVTRGENNPPLTANCP